MKKPSATLQITSGQGRCFTICPGCTAVQSPVPLSAVEFTCRHCGCEFTLKAPKKPKEVPCPT